MDSGTLTRMYQPMRVYALRAVARQVGALAFAGLLAFTVSATQSGKDASAKSAQSPPAGTSIEGPARVVDGDTIVIGEVRIRLEGIDAPESGQTCNKQWLGTWPCGEEATQHLARLVRDRVVRCNSSGTDAYGRMLGICFTEGLELNADMVRNGMAWAFVKYSLGYVEAETAARTLRLGIWQGNATPAWVWRAQRWSDAAGSRSALGAGELAGAANRAQAEACVIKGNVTRNGQIYHMPWSPWYGRTRIEPERGERWFCTESEALAAGWRPAYSR